MRRDPAQPVFATPIESDNDVGLDPTFFDRLRSDLAHAGRVALATALMAWRIGRQPATRKAPR